jgi:hypothetical protein
VKIKLIRTGGLLPVTKEAVGDVDWSEKEFGELMLAIGTGGDSDSSARDQVYHILEANGKSFPIDLTKIPKAYRPVFDMIISNFKTVKF